MNAPRTSRETPTRRSTPHLGRETPPPPTQTLQHQSETITPPCYKTTMVMTASPAIYRQAPTSSPDAPPKKKPRIRSPTTTTKIPTMYFRIDIESEYPLHEKYDLQDVYSRWLSWMRVRLETRRSLVWPPPRSATFFREDWSWNIFYGHSLPSADSRRAVVSFWRKNVHNTGWPLRGLSQVNVWLGK